MGLEDTFRSIPQEDRAMIRALVRHIGEGYTAENVAEVMVVSRMTIAAVRAHLTMGTYEQDAEKKKKGKGGKC